MIKYTSTRDKSKSLRASEAIIAGISGDGGLYVPDSIPSIPMTIEEMLGKPYKEIAFHIIKAFFQDFSDDEIRQCVESAYGTNFESEDIVPIKDLNGKTVLELYHGATSAFKDMALSILPHLLTTALIKEDVKKKICILTATSGDTGKAALEGFSNVPGTEIFVFYPKDGVSQVQERQMTTQEGDNTHVFAIKGNFDDAQTAVKEIFNDKAFSDIMLRNDCLLSSANSINIGRLIPQVAYYVYGYVKLVENGTIADGDPVNVVVPTGNFGNILAAYYAFKMGIPFKTFICASNENKVLTDFIDTGLYDTNRNFKVTNSPSMDILISSNLERLLYTLSDENSVMVKDLMSQLSSSKKYQIDSALKENLSSFYGGYCNELETSETIAEVFHSEGYLIDTHTAVAFNVLQKYVKETGDDTHALIASTASPYKFAESVAAAIGLEPESDGFETIISLNDKTGVKVPIGLTNLDNKAILHDKTISIDEMRDVISEPTAVRKNQ